MVGMIGEKYETRQLKEQLAAFFTNRDYIAAKNYFLECYNKRPDVLMEASDVNGELRLCMQIISTCEFEDAAYGRCILDHFRDYQILLRHFRRMNGAVTNFINGHTKPEDFTLFEQNTAITPVSIEIAVRLFCTDESKQADIIQKICELHANMKL